MARPKRPPALIDATPPISESFTQEITIAQNTAADQYDRALALAGELGYQGAVTVDALEGEIRFYQRRTVEAILETGKRLLVLKELTPHGEFMQRVQELGFARSTAQRFMQAAVKASKLPTLGNLAKEMKSARAFLELVTHDDDADLEALTELDDIDRMSASQVRAALRDAKAEREATQKLLDDKNRTLDTLQANLEQAIKGKPAAPPDEVGGELRKALAVAGQGAEHAVRDALTEAIRALSEHVAEHGGDATSLAAGCVMQVQQALNDVRDEFSLPAFQNYVPSWLPETAAGVSAAPDAPLADGDVRLDDLAEVPLDRA